MGLRNEIRRDTSPNSKGKKVPKTIKMAKPGTVSVPLPSLLWIIWIGLLTTHSIRCSEQLVASPATVVRSSTNPVRLRPHRPGRQTRECGSSRVQGAGCIQTPPPPSCTHGLCTLIPQQPTLASRGSELGRQQNDPHVSVLSMRASVWWAVWHAAQHGARSIWG